MNVPDASIKCLEYKQPCGMYVYNILYASVHEYVYNSSVGGYDWDFCVCKHYLCI